VGGVLGCEGVEQCGETSSLLCIIITIIIIVITIAIII